MPIPTKQERLKQRNEQIRKRFRHYTRDKKLDKTYVVEEKLTSEFLPLQASTIWLILRFQGVYKNL